MKKSGTPRSPSSASGRSDWKVPNFELPDPGGFVSEPPGMTLAQVLPLLEELRRWPMMIAAMKNESQERCLVEFVL